MKLKIQISKISYIIHLFLISDCKDWVQKWPNMKFGVVSDNFDPKLVRGLPLSRILLETDAPYFRPSVLDEIQKFKIGKY